MKIYNYLLSGLLVLTTVWSCDRMNDLHDKYLKDGEIIYTMKVDSAQVMAGENRVMLRYYTTDAKAKKLLVYWNLKTESQVFDIPVKNAGEPVDVYINNLDEGPVYFDLYTLNEKMENQSVPFNVDGYVYGDIFQQSLINRKCDAFRLYPDNHISITWYNADSKIAGSEIRYKNKSGQTVNHTALVDEAVTVIKDMSEDADYVEFRTMYRPEPDAVDIFFTSDYVQFKIVDEDVNITDWVMKNTTYPYVAGANVVGGYYEAADWIVSSNIAPNGNVGSGYLQLIAYAGDSPVLGNIPNVKLYQTFELDAGKYRFKSLGYGIWGNSEIYMAAALGDELPDTEDLEQDALASATIRLVGGWTTEVTQIEFTLSEKSTISLGFVGNLTSSVQLAFNRNLELWWIRSE